MSRQHHKNYRKEKKNIIKLKDFADEIEEKRTDTIVRETYCEDKTRKTTKGEEREKGYKRYTLHGRSKGHMHVR